MRLDDDLPPTGEEANAQRVRPILPLIWMAVGLVAVLVFVAFLLINRNSNIEPSAAVVAPAERPAPN